MTRPSARRPLLCLVLLGSLGIFPSGFTQAVLAQNAPAPNTPAQPSPAANPTLDVNLRQTLGRYILGAGDRVKVDVFDVPELSGEQQVLPDGTISLPLVGPVQVEGLSLEATTERVKQLLAPYLVRNIVSVTLVAPRPLTVAIVGEVNRPGSYSLAFNQDTRVVGGTGASGAAGSTQSSTLTGALQTAGGITDLADVRNVQISRLTPSGERATLNINLWDLLQKGDISQDVRIFDGDAILVPRTANLTPQERTELALATFSPATISVQVVGEVVRPGTLTLRPNAPFTEAIVAAGSITNDGNWRKVELYRLEPDGRITRRNLRADLNQPLNDQTNPSLRNRDLIVVRPSFGSSVLRGLGILGTGLSGVINPVNLIDGLIQGND